MTLADLLDHARADELSESQATEIEKVDNINTMAKRNKTSSKPWQRSGNQFQRIGSGASADKGGKAYIFSVRKSVKKTAKVKIRTSHINMMVDSVSTVNIMS